MSDREYRTETVKQTKEIEVVLADERRTQIGTVYVVEVFAARRIHEREGTSIVAVSHLPRCEAQACSSVSEACRWLHKLWAAADEDGPWQPSDKERLA